jgi:hypothetical protein
VRSKSELARFGRTDWLIRWLEVAPRVAGCNLKKGG